MIHKRIQFARQFMHDAVDWKIIEENPFLKVKTQKSSVKVNEFVPREVVDKLMKKANPVWQVILGLSRYGELRTPSETLSLRWDDKRHRPATSVQGFVLAVFCARSRPL